MGIWKDIKHALNSTLGTSSFTPLDQKIDDVKSSIMAAGGIKVVKSVQRGIAIFNTTDVSITLNSINTSKSIILLEGSVVESSTQNIVNVIIKSLTSTKLTLTTPAPQYGTQAGYKVSWQVIEFY